MLGKLFRQEVKEQGRTMSFLYIILVAATGLLSVFLLLGRWFGGVVLAKVYSVLAFLYLLTVIVLFVACFIYLCRHFYQTMYSVQGYLTHTLPVKTTHILNVKIAVSVMYLLITGVCAILSVLMIGAVNNRKEMERFFQELAWGMSEASAELGLPKVVFLVFLVIVAILGYLDALLVFFAGSSIGQLSGHSKGAYGIAAGIGLYYVSQIVSMVFIGLGGVLYIEKFGDRVTVHLAGIIMAGVIALLLFWAIVYYLISRAILLKHLNLE